MAQRFQTIAQSPYYDDFDPAKDYLRVLFRPSYPVQARELTTLQSFIQEQVARFGDHVFKEGARVTNGSVTVSKDVERLTVSGSGNILFPPSGAEGTAVLTKIGDLEGLVITNDTGTVKARVIKQPAGTSDLLVANMYVKYLTAEKFSSSGGYFYARPIDNPGQNQTFYNTYGSKSAATVANVFEGVYYVRGAFVRVAEQTVVVDPASATASCHLGFTALENVVTQNEDSTLFDNARGTTNEGSPGAHRLKISLTFATKSLDAAADSNFFRVATIVEGTLAEQTEIGEDYNALLDVLARRTFDESGHYALKPFTHVVGSGDSDSVFSLSIGPSKAYVKGYEVTKNSTTKITFEKGLTDTAEYRDYKVPFAGTTCVEIENLNGGYLPGQNGGNPYASTSRILLNNSSGDTIGVAKAYAVLNETQKGVAKTKLYFYDIKMFSALTFASTAFGSAIATGNDLVSEKVRGSVYKTDGNAGVVNGVVVIDTNGRFRAGTSVKSTILDSETTIVSATHFTTSQIASIEGSDTSFTCDVVANTFENSNSELIVTLDETIKTTKDGSNQLKDNNYEVMKAVLGTPGTGTVIANNGTWDVVDVDDTTGFEIAKTLKFAYMKIKASSSHAGSNYGWLAGDKEISLFYPDIHRVYKVNQSTANSFATGRFARITVTNGNGVLVPQGATLVGQTSGSKAVAALSNSSIAEGSVASNTTFHRVQTGTGQSTNIEVVFEKGSSFTTDEIVRVFDINGLSIGTVVYKSVTAATGSDITGLFSYDDGQRGEFYDVGRLIRKDNTPAPSTDIVVFFSYFDATPSGSSHFYCVDSYSTVDFFGTDVRYKTGPQEIGAVNKPAGRNLRNSIDFRLRVQTMNDVTKSPFSFAARSFQTQTRVLPKSQFTTDMDVYLGRVDMLSLLKDGQFYVKKGIPGSIVKRPEEIEDAMTLSFITIPPAVRYPEYEINVDLKSNKRFTMADIGVLENRISNVEKAVALSMLESQALHDDVEGRTKMGFVVDDFSVEFTTNQSPADFENVEFEASVDTVNKLLIPAQTGGKPVPMQIKSGSESNISSFFEDYVINNFTEEVLVEQKNATSQHKINPFAVWLYRGDLKMTPNEDNWRIEKNNYFINRFGQSSPVSAEEFEQFGQITTSSPGGVSTVVKEWVGQESRTTLPPGGATQQALAAARANGNVGNWLFATGTLQAVEVRQAQRTISTTVFDSPRADGAPIRTLSGSQIIENPQDYKMRAITVAFVAKGLRPKTPHKAFFGGQEILATVVADDNGEISGSFTIPGNTFPAGTQSFELRDTTLNGGLSSATATFRSIGHLDTFNVTQNTATSVTTVGLEQGALKRVDWVDPIAQMFMLPIDEISGLPKRATTIVTSVDLWFGFVDTRTSMAKVIVEIREGVNGYPGGPDKILGTTGLIDVSKANEVTAPTASNHSNFKLLEPVVLAADKEYAVVVKSPSDQTTVFVATMGEKLLDGTGVHDSQPLVGGYAGSFFVSQNSSTWNADQNTDMTFRIHRAKFDTNTKGQITLANKFADTNEFQGDIGAYNQGLAIETFEGSRFVKVYHPNHGLNFSSASVKLTGLGTSGTTVLNGIPVDELQDIELDVRFPTLHSYFVETSTAATISGKPPVPVFGTFATQCLVYDNLICNLLAKKSEQDSIDISMTATETCPVNLAVSANKMFNSTQTARQPNYTAKLQMGAVAAFENPLIVSNDLNRLAYNDLEINVELTSGTDYTSPFFKKGTNLNPIVFRNLVGNLLNDSDIEGLTRRVGGGVDSDEEFASFIAGVQSETEHNAYVTKQIDIELPADGFTILFDADMEPGSAIELSYKARPLGDNTPFDSLEWTPFSNAQQINEKNYGPFTSGFDMRSFTVRTSTAFEFTSFKIRLRFRTTNEALIPRVKDLRIIADM